MKIIPGNALVQTTPGAAARPDHPASRPQGLSPSAHAPGAVDPDTRPQDARPVVQASGSERPRANLPRGSLVDIRV